MTGLEYSKYPKDGDVSAHVSLAFQSSQEDVVLLGTISLPPQYGGSCRRSLPSRWRLMNSFPSHKKEARLHWDPVISHNSSVFKHLVWQTDLPEIATNNGRRNLSEFPVGSPAPGPVTCASWDRAEDELAAWEKSINPVFEGSSSSLQGQGQPLAFSRFLCSYCILCFICILLQLCIWDGNVSWYWLYPAFWLYAVVWLYPGIWLYPLVWH